MKDYTGNSTFDIGSAIIILSYFCLLAFMVWVMKTGGVSREYVDVSTKMPKDTVGNVSTAVAVSDVIYGVLASEPCDSNDKKCLEWNSFMAGKTVIIER